MQKRVRPSDQVIRDIFLSSDTGEVLSKRYGVSIPKITGIRNQTIHKDVTGDLPKRDRRRDKGLTPEQIAQIRASDEPLRVLARRFGVTLATISRYSPSRRLSQKDRAAVAGSTGPVRDIADLYGISTTTVKKLRHDRRMASGEAPRRSVGPSKPDMSVQQYIDRLAPWADRSLPWDEIILAMKAAQGPRIAYDPEGQKIPALCTTRTIPIYFRKRPAPAIVLREYDVRHRPNSKNMHVFRVPDRPR